MKISRKNNSAGFTLIELLIVIAIIAILAVVVVITLNPVEFLAQGRDANRVSDLGTISEAITLTSPDALPLGTANKVYVSIPDSSPTCADLGLPTLSMGWGYACAPTSTYRQTNGTGWIPINFSQASMGTPLPVLPIDPTNSTSSGLYYEYITNGSQWELLATPESQKYTSQIASAAAVPGHFSQGSNTSMFMPYNVVGLVGYWKLNEGSGGTATDTSGNSTNGTWQGTQSGTGGTYYGSGNNQTYAGYFNGSNNYINGMTVSSTPQNGPATITGWFNFNTFAVARGISNQLDTQLYQHSANNYLYIGGGGADYFNVNSILTTTGVWYFIALTYNGTHETDVLYINGAKFNVNIQTPHTNNSSISSFVISPSTYFPGLIENVRVYNRVLSAAELQALYNSGQ
jgi:prepilin-type N-terminal cleavage/methylation domain-containing protein